MAYGRYAVSSGDTLVLQSSGSPVGDTELITADRLGREISVVAPLAEYYSPSISHDGRRFAVDIIDIQSTHGDVWIFDLERETGTRLAYGELDESDPVWSPDDRELYYRRVPDIFRRDAYGARPEETVLTSPVNKEPEDVSPDGRLMIFESESDERADRWLLDLETGHSEVWLQNPWRERDARFSPDGRWVAYTSEESGAAEIHVRSFSAGDRRIVVSTGGGVSPLWSADGSELLYYSASSEVVSVPVEWIEGEPSFGEMQPLFRVRLRRTDHGFDVFPDGSRFLLNRVGPRASHADRWMEIAPEAVRVTVVRRTPIRGGGTAVHAPALMPASPRGVVEPGRSPSRAPPVWTRGGDPQRWPGPGRFVEHGFSYRVREWQARTSHRPDGELPRDSTRAAAGKLLLSLESRRLERESTMRRTSSRASRPFPAAVKL